MPEEASEWDDEQAKGWRNEAIGSWAYIEDNNLFFKFYCFF